MTVFRGFLLFPFRKGFMLWGLFFALIFACGSLYAQSANKLGTVLADYGVTLKEQEESAVIQDFSFLARGKKYRTITAQNQDVHIEIEIRKPLSPQDAREYSESQYAILKSLYAPQIIPYTGEFTKTTDCPPDKKPQELTFKILGKETRILVAGATARYTFGVWEEELIKYRGAFCVIYDEERSAVFKITILKPAAGCNPQDLVDILAGFKRITS